jgi:hypothetical protein
VRNRRRVGNLRYADTGSLNRANRAFTASASALHTNFTFVHALGNRNARSILSDHRRGKCC